MNNLLNILLPKKFLPKLLTLEFHTAWFLLIFAIVIGPYYNITWPDAGFIGACVLLGAGALLCWLLVGPADSKLGDRFMRIVYGKTITFILLFGVLCQIVITLLTNPTATSDPLSYLLLAEKIAIGQPYVDRLNNKAFFPPGLPFFLAPFGTLFGANIIAVASANIVLYLIGAIATWELAKRLFDTHVGAAATLLFTIWPSRLLTAGVASKENLTIAMILAVTALCVALFAARGRKAWFLAAAAGIALGLATLAQPGFLLFILILPLSYRYALNQVNVGSFLARIAVIAGFMVICLVPWHVRNCIEFNGQFCGLTTNGGSTFYRANNPKATGIFTPEGEPPISHLPELEENRVGFELGKQWIREHPVEFVKLSIKKLIHFVGSDDYGAYWAIFRGEGGDHGQAQKLNTPSRMSAFRTAEVISWLFWIVLMSWAARAIMPYKSTRPIYQHENFLPLIYPLLYSAVIFSIVESGSRQHMAAIGPLILVAAASIVHSKSAKLAIANDTPG